MPQSRSEQLLHTPRQRARLEALTGQARLTCLDAIDQLSGFLLAVAEVRHAREPLAHVSEVLKGGGTLKEPQIDVLRQKSGDFRGWLSDIRTEMADVVGAQSREGLSIKSYRPFSRPGSTLHRDSRDGPPKLLDQVVLHGPQRVGFWVAPLRLEVPRLPAAEGVTRARCLERLPAVLDDKEVELRPLQVVKQTIPGEVLLWDERPERGSVWEDPALGEVALHHSVWIDFPKHLKQPADSYAFVLTGRTHSHAAHVPGDERFA